jgi:hypothetical protein
VFWKNGKNYYESNKLMTVEKPWSSVNEFLEVKRMLALGLSLAAVLDLTPVLGLVGALLGGLL